MSEDVIDSLELSAVIAEHLAKAGVDTVVGVPGGGNNLDLIGAAEAAGLRFVLAHAETPATVIAAVHADLTGVPTACVVTRGPGAASAVNGVANALLDRQQLVLVTDRVSAADHDRVPHQRLDQQALFSPVTKWSAAVGAGDPASTLAHGIATAMTHPRGPVHLDFDPTSPSTVPPADVPGPVPDPEAMARLGSLLASARRPVVVLGVGVRPVVGAVRALLQDSPAPVLMTYRAKGAVPDSWPSAAGLLTGATTEAPLLAAADLIVMIGFDAVELIPGPWPYAAPVVSVGGWADPSAYVPRTVEVVGDLETLVPQLAEHWPRSEWEHDAGNRHRDSELARLVAAGPEAAHGVGPQSVVRSVRAAAPAGATATVDAGAHMLPAMSLWHVEELDEVLISSGLATMGYAVPAAIGAALARPGRRIVCFTGDGGLGMALGELETIARLGLPVTIVVFDDARLSLIAIKARPEGNGGDGATRYRDVDFAAVAEGYGIPGARVETVDQLDAALTSAFARPGPTLVDVRVDPSAYPEILAAVRGPRPVT